jgi:Na+-translocating ferredoxin:NAD+ oxidoreductase RnfC subunit
MLDLIRNAGVVGAGGGGFPTHVKFGSRAEVVIANGAECEPLARVDQQRMAAEPETVIRGLQLAMQITGAGRGVLALKKKYLPAIEALHKKLSGPDRPENVTLFELEDFYPAGDEFVLVKEVTERVIPEFGLPLKVGAVVSNVSTLIDVGAAVDQGQPVTHRFVTVAGEVAHPSTFRVPIGTPLAKLVEASGGARVGHPRLIAGGPMMGSLVTQPDPVVTKTSSVLLVLPESHPVVQRRLRSIERQLHLTRSACLKCFMCTEICPRNLLGHRLYPDRLMRNVAAGVAEDPQAFAGAYLCSECGLCAVYGCVMSLDPCAMNRELKARLREAGVKPPEPLSPPVERIYGPVRRVPSKRLIARLGVAAYDRPAPMASFGVKLSRLKVPLKQHTGVPASPVVSPGQRVQEGDLLADVSPGDLGARVHAGRSGIVKVVNRDEVEIDVE